jgi:hypothetical protein
VIYADILISCSLAAVLEIYTQHFTRRLHFAQQYASKLNFYANSRHGLWNQFMGFLKVDGNEK